jgi:hypothetical protein
LSELIEASAQGLVDTFGNETLRNSSNNSPIAYFILKNAISYGMFELRRKNMNWPTETVPPFMFDTYKVGFSLVF